MKCAQPVDAEFCPAVVTQLPPRQWLGDPEKLRTSIATTGIRALFMKLIVAGMKPGEQMFQHLWGRYVIGFRPWVHCIRCLWTKHAKAIRPTMSDGEYELDDSFGLFYLCAVGWKQKHDSNVHLAIRPRPGSVACAGSVYGVTFTITDAQAILIKYLPKGWRGLLDEQSQCKNFQFGYQMFDANEVGDTAPRRIVTKLRAEPGSGTCQHCALRNQSTTGPAHS
jgi:hypothetical protein